MRVQRSGRLLGGLLRRIAVCGLRVVDGLRWRADASLLSVPSLGSSSRFCLLCAAQLSRIFVTCSTDYTCSTVVGAFEIFCKVYVLTILLFNGSASALLVMFGLLSPAISHIRHLGSVSTALGVLILGNSSRMHLLQGRPVQFRLV